MQGDEWNRHREHAGEHRFGCGQRPQAQRLADVGQGHERADPRRADAEDRLDGKRDHAKHREHRTARGQAGGDGWREALAHGQDDDDVDGREVGLADELNRPGAGIGREQHRDRAAGDVAGHREIERRE